jgi:hypothetical protein
MATSEQAREEHFESDRSPRALLSEPVSLLVRVCELLVHNAGLPDIRGVMGSHMTANYQSAVKV